MEGITNKNTTMKQLIIILLLIAFVSCKTEQSIRATHNVQGTGIDSFKNGIWYLKWSTVSNDSGYIDTTWEEMTPDTKYYYRVGDGYSPSYYYAKHKQTWDAIMVVLIELSILILIGILAYIKDAKERNIS
jgi:hypothetical protein